MASKNEGQQAEVACPMPTESCADRVDKLIDESSYVKPVQGTRDAIIRPFRNQASDDLFTIMPIGRAIEALGIESDRLNQRAGRDTHREFAGADALLYLEEAVDVSTTTQPSQRPRAALRRAPSRWLLIVGYRFNPHVRLLYNDIN